MKQLRTLRLERELSIRSLITQVGAGLINHLNKKEVVMGLTKRKDGWYVEFPVVDYGKALSLARGTPGSKLKRWKTLTPNKTMAKQQEAKIKIDLMMGKITSERL